MSPAKAKARSYRALLKARLRDPGVSIEARALWCVIESFSDKNGRNAFPAVVTLAAICKKQKAWVEKYLRELQAKQWLGVHKEPTEKGWKNVYTCRHPDNWGDEITDETWVDGYHEIRGKGVATKNGVTGNHEIRGTTGYQMTGAARTPAVEIHDDDQPLEERREG